MLVSLSLALNVVVLNFEGKCYLEFGRFGARSGSSWGSAAKSFWEKHNNLFVHRILIENWAVSNLINFAKETLQSMKTCKTKLNYNTLILLHMHKHTLISRCLNFIICLCIGQFPWFELQIFANHLFENLPFLLKTLHFFFKSKCSFFVFLCVKIERWVEFAVILSKKGNTF